MGRKTFQPELKELAEELAVKITGIFIDHIEFLRPDTGAEKILIPDREKYEWVKKLEEYREQHQLPYNTIHKNFTYLCKPLQEQDAIALFHQLVGSGVIRGLFFFCTDSNSRYDSLMEYKYEDSGFLYSDSNRLGVRNNMPLNVPSEPKIVEYKYDFDTLLEDILKEKKFFEHLGLIVCWKATGDYTKNLILKSLLIGNEGNIRTIFGATHIAFLPGEYANHKVEVIVLEELISYLLDPEHEIINQKSKYDYR
jgi:hypothetical protein